MTVSVTLALTIVAFVAFVIGSFSFGGEPGKRRLFVDWCCLGLALWCLSTFWNQIR